MDEQRTESGVQEGEMNLGTEFKWCESIVEAELRDQLSGDDLKSKLSACVGKLRRVMELLEKMDLYSANEELEELSTHTLNYLLTPAYLAFALDALNLDVREETSRVAVLQETKVHGVTIKPLLPHAIRIESAFQSLYRQFLESLLFFNLIDFDLPWLRTDPDGDDEERGKPGTIPVATRGSFAEAVAGRDRKIRRHNQLAQLQEARGRLALEQRHNNDESTQRESTIVLLRLWSIRAIEALAKIDEELRILDYAMSAEGGGVDAVRAEPERKKIPLFTIAKSEAQKRVLGAGYPAVPTVTVDEWFDQMQQEQAFGRPMCAQMKPREEKPRPSWQRRERHEEELEDRDDEDEEKAKDEENRPDESQEKRSERRDKDEWRDTHRRGWGNVHNKG